MCYVIAGVLRHVDAIYHRPDTVACDKRPFSSSLSTVVGRLVTQDAAMADDNKGHCSTICYKIHPQGVFRNGHASEADCACSWKARRSHLDSEQVVSVSC